MKTEASNCAYLRTGIFPFVFVRKASFIQLKVRKKYFLNGTY